MAVKCYGTGKMVKRNVFMCQCVTGAYPTVIMGFYLLIICIIYGLPGLWSIGARLKSCHASLI